MIGLLHQ